MLLKRDRGMTLRTATLARCIEMGFRGLVRLREALAESDLPILVDVQDWARLPGEMRREVERAHVVLQDPPALPPAA